MREALSRKAAVIASLQRHAYEHAISLFTVYRQAQAYAHAHRQPPLRLNEGTGIHAVRNQRRGPLVSAPLFDPLPPEPLAYPAVTRDAFGSAFSPVTAALSARTRPRGELCAANPRSAARRRHRDSRCLDVEARRGSRSADLAAGPPSPRLARLCCRPCTLPLLDRLHAERRKVVVGFVV